MGNDDRDQEIEENLKALELRLAAWRPAAGALDRDRMLYEAGQAAARAYRHNHAWQVATAALLFLTVALSGLLARQTSLLSRERSLLAQERTERKRFGLPSALVAPALSGQPSGLPDGSAPNEPFAPASYFVLTSHLVASAADASWDQAEGATPSHRRDPARPAEAPAPTPLRTRDVQRVLDL
jgi:hypothetical protein